MIEDWAAERSAPSDTVDGTIPLGSGGESPPTAGTAGTCGGGVSGAGTCGGAGTGVIAALGTGVFAGAGAIGAAVFTAPAPGCAWTAALPAAAAVAAAPATADPIAPSGSFADDTAPRPAAIAGLVAAVGADPAAGSAVTVRRGGVAARAADAGAAAGGGGAVLAAGAGRLARSVGMVGTGALCPLASIWTFGWTISFSAGWITRAGGAATFWNWTFTAPPCATETGALLPPFTGWLGSIAARRAAGGVAECGAAVGAVRGAGAAAATGVRDADCAAAACGPCAGAAAG
ncbi:MAG TPA: hypothetical protein VHW23_34910 [Kofleriaceae bacterium]|nr:hypothetical protein [Kofleriaceae bacterium]